MSWKTVGGVELAGFEERLARIHQASLEVSARQAPARQNTNCAYRCVRQYCGLLWPSKSVNTATGAVDIGVEVTGEPTEYGFSATATRPKWRVSVVHTPDVGQLVAPFEAGQRLRLLSAWAVGDVVKIKTWTEVFRHTAEEWAR